MVKAQIAQMVMQRRVWFIFKCTGWERREVMVLGGRVIVVGLEG
jgi:hypothetical protein